MDIIDKIVNERRKGGKFACRYLGRTESENKVMQEFGCGFQSKEVLCKYVNMEVPFGPAFDENAAKNACGGVGCIGYIHGENERQAQKVYA